MLLERFLSELKRRNVIRVGGVYAVTAWGLFQVANTVFQTLNFPKWAAPLVLVLLAFGFPLSLILAWAFERGPEGSVQRTKRGEPEFLAKITWTDSLLLTATLLVIGITSAQIFGMVPSADRATVVGARVAEKSVAVLPFANYSAVQDSEYFADGLTEEVINSLAQIPDLKVAGRTSAFYFKGKNEDLREIGRRLGVAHVVEGSVRRDGENLRVTAQLVSVKDGFHLWSKTYDRKMDDAFAIQTEIAEAVADALKARLESSVRATKAKRDPEAYRLELTARAHLRRWGLDDLKAARALYEQLIAREPNNASAYAGFAQATMLLAQNHLAIDFPQARKVSEAAVDKALAINPKSVDALLAKAVLSQVLLVRTSGAKHSDEMAKALRAALAIDPRNPEALNLFAVHLWNNGQEQAALDYANRALAVDPLNRVSQMLAANALRRAGKAQEAERAYRAVIDLYPDFDEAKLALGQSLMASGKLDQAEPWIKGVTASGEDPGSTVDLAALYLNLGLPAEADAALAAIKPPVSVIFAPIRMAARGDFAGAMTYAEAQLKTNEDPIWPQLVIIGAVATGDDQKAVATLRTLMPELMVPQPTISVSELDTPLIAAHAIKAAGDRAQARRLCERVLALTERPAGVWTPMEWRIARVRAFAELGENPKAVAELNGAYAAGWRTLFDPDAYMWLDKHPNTEGLQGDPAFQAIIAKVRADLAVQRAALLAQRR